MQKRWRVSEKCAYMHIFHARRASHAWKKSSSHTKGDLSGLAIQAFSFWHDF